MHDQKFTQGTTNKTFPYESFKKSTSDTVRHLINCTGSKDIPEDSKISHSHIDRGCPKSVRRG